MNEEEILTLFQRDAEAASEALVAQYRRLLWGICARRLNAPEDIDECVYAALAEFCTDALQNARLEMETIDARLAQLDKPQEEGGTQWT